MSEEKYGFPWIRTLREFRRTHAEEVNRYETSPYDTRILNWIRHKESLKENDES